MFSLQVLINVSVLFFLSYQMISKNRHMARDKVLLSSPQKGDQGLVFRYTHEHNVAKLHWVRCNYMSELRGDGLY